MKRACLERVRGRILLAGCLNAAGAAFMLFLLAMVLPVHVTGWLGYESCEVLTDSMEPEYPAGSMVYVKRTEPEEVEPGDVILYEMGTDTELTMLHRVMEICEEGRQFITKGDANAYPDKDPVSYSRLIGRAVFCLPFPGQMFYRMRTGPRIGVCVMIFACSPGCWMLAEILLRQAKKEQGKERGK